jgi:3D (Asp-Asp-Asp) domain-containing protein
MTNSSFPPNCLLHDRNEIPDVLDRGGAIEGDHVDVVFRTHAQAKQWGVRWLKVRRVGR